MGKISKSKLLLTVTAASLLAGGIKAYQTIISGNDINNFLNAGNENILEESVTFIPSEIAVAESNFENIPLYESAYNSPVEIETNQNISTEKVRTSIRDKFKEATEAEGEKESPKERESENISENDKTEADKIADEIVDEINDKTAEIENYPDSDERTEPANNPIRGIIDEVWKIPLMFGLGALAAAGIVATGVAVGVQKSKKNKALKNDTKYFVGPEYIRDVNTLIGVSKEIDNIENEIQKLNRKAGRQRDLNKKNSLLQKAKALEEGEARAALKKLKNHLIVKVNRVVKNDIKTTPKKLSILKKYAKYSIKTIKSPEINNTKLSRSLSKSLKRYNKVVESNSKTKENQISYLKNNIVAFLNKMNLKINLEEIQNKKAEKQLTKKTKKTNKLQTSIKRAYSLTGFNKVLLTDILNSNEKMFDKNNLDKIKDLATYLESAKGNYKKHKLLLLNQIKANQLIDNNKNNKAQKYQDKVVKLQNELAISNPRADLKYYGYINNIFNTPINPSRFVSSNVKNEDIKTFFDKVFCSHISKNKKTYEVTLSYNVGEKATCFACSFDNKEATDLMTSKFMTSIPENATNINLIEKSRSFSGINYGATQTNISAKKNSDGDYNEYINNCKRTVAEFEETLKLKPAETVIVTQPTTENKPVKNLFQNLKKRESGDKRTDLKSARDDILESMGQTEGMGL